MQHAGLGRQQSSLFGVKCLLAARDLQQLHVVSPSLCAQAELGAELEEELRSFGISPQAHGLTDSQLCEAAAELERRRAAARLAMSPGDRQRYDYMRATVGWHVQRVRGGLK